jgi:toxin-antitoxin system PIN domain toxin
VSFALDVNVLLDATNQDSERHAQALSFLGERVRSREIFCLPWLVAMSFVRIATDPRIFRSPLLPREALQLVESLVDLPQVQPLSERPGFLGVYREIAEEPTARGRFVPDAHLAAILLQHGVRTLYTSDRDFLRFPFLDVRDPYPTDIADY